MPSHPFGLCKTPQQYNCPRLRDFSMAPHGEPADSVWSIPTYMPSNASIEALGKQLRLNHAKMGVSNTWVSSGPVSIDSHDRAEGAKDWVLQLTLSDLQEIEDAVTHFESTKLPLNRLQAQHFPLPTLGQKIRKRSMLLHNEKPFFMIRGLKPQWFSKYKNVVVHLGISSHVGTKRAIARGDPTSLHHITNIELQEGEEKTIYRGPGNRTMALPFHNDTGEIISLYSLSRPASGGSFYLADVHDVVPQVEKSQPQLLKVLRENYTMVNPNLEKGYDERPLLYTTPSNGMVLQVYRARLCHCIRDRPSNIPALSPQQIQAIDALHVAGQEVARKFEFRSGDMLFFNNMRMMHARDSYVDGIESENTTARYLLRLILKDERNDGWELPSELEQPWKDLFDHDDQVEIIPVLPTLYSYKAAH